MEEIFNPSRYEFPPDISEQQEREKNFSIDCLSASIRFTRSNLSVNSLSDALCGLQIPSPGIINQKDVLATQTLLAHLKDNPLILLVMRRPRNIGIFPSAVVKQEPGQIFPLLYDYDYTGKKFPQVNLNKNSRLTKPIAADRQAVINATDILKTAGRQWIDPYTLAFSGRPDGRLDVYRVYNLLGFNTEMNHRLPGQLPLIIEEMMEYHHLDLYAGITLPRVNS